MARGGVRASGNPVWAGLQITTAVASVAFVVLLATAIGHDNAGALATNTTGTNGSFTDSLVEAADVMDALLFPLATNLTDVIGTPAAAVAEAVGVPSSLSGAAVGAIATGVVASIGAALLACRASAVRHSRQIERPRRSSNRLYRDDPYPEL